jgi:hypothetical protein
MDRVLDCEHFKPRQIRFINYCRLFLQVYTISSKVDRVSSLVRQVIWKYTKNVQILRRRGLLGESVLSGAIFARAPYINL